MHQSRQFETIRSANICKNLRKKSKGQSSFVYVLI
jgi:hypothetical protein